MYIGKVYSATIARLLWLMEMLTNLGIWNTIIWSAIFNQLIGLIYLVRITKMAYKTPSDKAKPRKVDAYIAPATYSNHSLDTSY